MARSHLLRGLLALAVLAGAGTAAAAPKAPAAPAAKPATPAVPAKPAAPEPEERIIEHTDADYVLRLTLRPGNPKLNHAAQADVEIIRKLQIPDPVTGDQMPITGIQPVATVKPPEPAPGTKHPEVKPTQKYLLWPAANPGVYAFHFTPTEDGIYEVSIEGTEAAHDGDTEGTSLSFKATYRIGAGLAAAQTEQSQGGTALRRSTRRPVGQGSTTEKERKLVKLMREISDRFLAVEAQVGNPKGTAEVAAEAHALAGLLSQAKGLVPDQSGGDADEFDKLATRAAAAFEEYATASGAKNAKAHPAIDPVESVGCTQCHAKYRFQITDDVSSWPKFAQKAVAQ